jgi:glycosyltransferase involved in cell wall biosynthesis
MRLALYHPWVYLRGGAERVLAEIVERSRHDWVLYTHHYEAQETFPSLKGSVVELGPPVSVRRALGPLVHAAATMANTRLPQDGTQALLVSSEGLGDLLLARNGQPAVAYCHTPLKILHDPLSREDLSRRDPNKAALLRMLGRPFQSVDAALWRRYRHVLVNSEETKRRVLAGSLAPESSVEVLYPGVDLSRFGAGFGELASVDAASEREPLLLVAGRMVWQKRIELAIDAFAVARCRGLDATMIIAGMVDEKSRDYVEGLKRRATGLPITFEEAPDDRRLAELYERATACIFTAPNEDWGIVPLEAMACGTPVLAVNSGGPRESVVHGRTGWLLPPEPRAFAEQMLVVAASHEDMAWMRRACRQHVARYDWDRFVRRIDDLMEEVAVTGRVVNIPRPMLEPDAAEIAGSALPTPAVGDSSRGDADLAPLAG